MIPLLAAALVPTPAAQIGKPKPTVPVGQASKTIPKLKTRLPRLMLLPLTNEIEPAAPQKTADEILGGYQAGIGELVKPKKGAVVEYVPVAVVQGLLDAAEKPYLFKDKDGHPVWDVAKMLKLAAAAKADFLGVARITEMTFAPEKSQAFNRGYLTVYRVSDRERVIKDGWLGGQSTGLGITTPKAVGREFATVSIPRRFWEGYGRDNWKPLTN